MAASRAFSARIRRVSEGARSEDRRNCGAIRGTPWQFLRAPDLLLFKLVTNVNVSLLTPSASLGRPALRLWLAAFALFARTRRHAAPTARA
jgi:hypothetical protein